MITLYDNHSRDLLWTGTLAAATTAGIELHRDTREVTINNERRKVVNQATERGHLLLWLASTERGI